MKLKYLFGAQERMAKLNQRDDELLNEMRLAATDRKKAIAHEREQLKTAMDHVRLQGLSAQDVAEKHEEEAIVERREATARKNARRKNNTAIASAKKKRKREEKSQARAKKRIIAEAVGGQSECPSEDVRCFAFCVLICLCAASDEDLGSMSGCVHFTVIALTSMW